MKFLKRYSTILFISFLLFLIIINIFKPIFNARELIFPYAITKFDMISKFPKVWFYIKLIYCISCFFNIFLAVNSIYKFFLIKKSNKENINKIETNINFENFKLFLGNNTVTKNKIYIPEKGLYQNILITGTIGSRKNLILYVPFLKSIH